MSIWHLDLNMKGYEVQLKVITTGAKSLARWTKQNILHKRDDFLPFLLVILVYLYNKSQHIILYQCFVLTDLHTVLHGNVHTDLHTVLDGNALPDLHTVLDGNAYLVMTYYVVVMVKDWNSKRIYFIWRQLDKKC